MVIKGVGNVAVPQGAKAGTGRSAAGFAVGSGAPAGGPAAVAATAGIDGLLLLQETESAPARDRRARQHGRAMLDALAKLQLALLGEGDEAGGHLATLGALIEHCPEAADPGLRDVLASVALRARVELARRGV